MARHRRRADLHRGLAAQRRRGHQRRVAARAVRPRRHGAGSCRAGEPALGARRRGRGTVRGGGAGQAGGAGRRGGDRVDAGGAARDTRPRARPGARMGTDRTALRRHRGRRGVAPAGHGRLVCRHRCIRPACRNPRGRGRCRACPLQRRGARGRNSSLCTAPRRLRPRPGSSGNGEAPADGGRGWHRDRLLAGNGCRDAGPAGAVC